MYKKISLNGSWKFQGGDREKPKKFLYKIMVPGLVDVASPKIAWEKYNYFWYRKDFTLRKWKKSIDKINTIDVSAVGIRYCRIEFSEHSRKWGLSSLNLNFKKIKQVFSVKKKMTAK